MTALITIASALVIGAVIVHDVRRHYRSLSKIDWAVNVGMSIGVASALDVALRALF